MGFFAPISTYMETKDRIRVIMEDQHMTQQEFADFLQQSPATLSSIFNGRTRPTLNVVDAIKMKIPDISIEWLLYGTGEKFVSHPSDIESPSQDVPFNGKEQMLVFDSSPSGYGQVSPSDSPVHVNANAKELMKGAHIDLSYDNKNMEAKEPRKVTEIRVYYDDQTYETFVPAKK